MPAAWSQKVVFGSAKGVAATCFCLLTAACLSVRPRIHCPAGVEDSSPSYDDGKGPCSCLAHRRHRPAVACGSRLALEGARSEDEERLVRASLRLRSRVALAARRGFDPETLGRAVPDAQLLYERWAHFLPSEEQVPELLRGYRLASGAEAFVRRLWLAEAAEAPDGAQSYCLFAHLTAIFVVLRLRPLKFANSVLGAHRAAARLSEGRPSAVAAGAGTGSVAWITRARRRGRALRLPREWLAELYTALHRALFLLGAHRALDQGRLVGWPVGSGELVELLDVLRAVCFHSRIGCTLGAFEAALTGRLRRARRTRLGPDYPLGESCGDAGSQGSCATRDILSWPVPRPAAGAAEPGRRLRLTAFMAGTHGAVFKELRVSWRAAISELSISAVSSINFQELSFSGAYLGSAPVPGAQAPVLRPLDVDKFLMSDLQFKPIHHTYILPYSLLQVMNELLQGWLRSASVDDAAVMVCTIPAITCATFAALSIPVVYYSVTTIAVQVPLENMGPWLKLYAQMSTDTKNHFVANSEAYEAMNEALVGHRLPVIPVLALYMNMSYVGHRSHQVLIYDRKPTLLLQGLCGLPAEEHPFRFVGLTETDRHYSTFARHFAVIFVPGGWTQMAFWEFYSMGVPLYVPADPGRYLWPPVPFALQADALTEEPLDFTRRLLHNDPRHAYDHWDGLHQFNTSVTAGPARLEIFVNLTLHRSAALDVAFFARGVGDYAGAAVLRPMRTMDERGNTHALEPVGAWGGPDGWSQYFFGGRCVRAASVDGLLQVFLGPVRGVCADLDRPGGCRAGAVRGCPAALWSPLNYLGEPPESTRRAERLRGDGAERGGFGEAFWYLGRTVLSRRRRQPKPYKDPMRISSHAALRRLARRLDMFWYPQVRRFLSGAELLRDLVALRRAPAALRERSRLMGEFLRARRAAGLEAWRGVLEAVVLHPSQERLQHGDI